MGDRPLLPVKVTGFNWLTEQTIEISLHRPAQFEFHPGQKIGVVHDNNYRDYSLIGSTQGTELTICVRRIPGGTLSPILAQAKVGDRLHITPAFGYFLYQPSSHPAVFVATGTGIAPFVAFVQAGVKNYHLLHGVRSHAELYYRDLLSPPARQYTPCLSNSEKIDPEDGMHFHGRVTEFLGRRLSRGAYDFYLCGRGEMLRDATRIIDRHFEGSRVYSELFF